MSQLWQERKRLEKLGIQVCVVTFDTGVLVRNYVAKAEWDWPLLVDQERSLYRAYAMGRGGWWAIYGLASIWNYIKLMCTGRMPGKPGSDFRQFGGDVLIDPDGNVQYHFTSSSPHDRPSVPSLILKVHGDEEDESD